MTHSDYMKRCLELAEKGRGYVAPNPMVGSVLVHEGRIIGEGYHQRYGEAHAEVNCINSVKQEDQGLISQSVLYVSLEPCAHFGKTPPCADLIIRNKIPHVVIACRDPFEEVDGKGIERLKAAGIKVELGILEKEAIELNKRFFTFNTLHRPYIILKWAQTADGKIAGKGNDRLLISNELTNRLVHKWRSEESSILVGTKTALADNPALTNRLWTGSSPVRLVIDRHLKLPFSLQLFDNSVKTIIFNTIKNEEKENQLFYKLNDETSLLSEIMHALYLLKIQSVIIEGGPMLQQSFIDEGLWDETRIITNTEMFIKEGLASPFLSKASLIDSYSLLTDSIQIFKRQA